MRAQRCGRSVHRVAVLLRSPAAAGSCRGSGRASARCRRDPCRARRSEWRRRCGAGRPPSPPSADSVTSVVTDGLAARAGRAARAVSSPAGTMRAESHWLVAEARRVVDDQVDDESELTLQSRVVADERAALVEVGPGPRRRVRASLPGPDARGTGASTRAARRTAVPGGSPWRGAERLVLVDDVLLDLGQRDGYLPRRRSPRASRRSVSVIRDSSYSRRPCSDPPSSTLIAAVSGCARRHGGDVGSSTIATTCSSLAESCTSPARNVRQCRSEKSTLLRPAHRRLRREDGVPHRRDRSSSSSGVTAIAPIWSRSSNVASFWSSFAQCGKCLKSQLALGAVRREPRGDEERDVEVRPGGARVRKGDDGEELGGHAHAPAKARQYSDQAGEVPSGEHP